MFLGGFKMKKYLKYILVTALLFGTLNNTTVITEAAYTSNNYYSENTTAITNQLNKKNSISAIGYGLPPQNGNKILARRAAIVDAQRNLLERINGVQIDSETFMEDFTISSDVVRSQVSGLIKGAVITDEGENLDGSYYVELSVPMYGRNGSIASVAIPALMANMQHQPFDLADLNNFTEHEVQYFNSSAYTGVIINAKEMNLERTFAPVIYDTDGRVIYGIQNLDKDLAITYGMVEYSESLEESAGGNSRAGNNPLVINAVDVKGGKNSVNKVNVVVSVEDGNKILLANERSGMLVNCAVVFVK